MDGTKDDIEEDNVGLDKIDGTAEGTPRLGSHRMSILSGSKCASHKAYTLGLSPVLKMGNLQ